MNVLSRNELLRACTILFGSHVDVSPEFLSYIQPSGVKSAYRKRALETHPDRRAHEGDGGSAEGFLETNWAYRHLLKFIRARDSLAAPYTAAENRPRPKRKPRRGDYGRSERRGSAYHSGFMPGRRLLLGQYLFYSGEIPWEALVKAIVWQRGQRPRLGEIAQRWGWLNEADIRSIVRKRKLGEHLGEALVRLNLLTTSQLNALLHYQRTLQKPFGEFFVLHSYLTRARLNRLLREFKSHNSRPHRHARK